MKTSNIGKYRYLMFAVPANSPEGEWTQQQLKETGRWPGEWLKSLIAAEMKRADRREQKETHGTK